ncbi:MAG TPA: hypothetical protein PKW79_05740 [Rhabdochlamydiaceae bacterium]|nr:hypothetical protein [Rhabdochlamydiaceae bacterium]
MGSNFLKFMICLFFFSFSVYSYLDKQNSCTALSMQLPKMMKEIESIQEKNANLRFQIECFENPQNLLEKASSPAYAHLKFPFTEEVLTVNEGLALQSGESDTPIVEDTKIKPTVVIGAK